MPEEKSAALFRQNERLQQELKKQRAKALVKERKIAEELDKSRKEIEILHNERRHEHEMFQKSQKVLNARNLELKGIINTQVNTINQLNMENNELKRQTIHAEGLVKRYEKQAEHYEKQVVKLTEVIRSSQHGEGRGVIIRGDDYFETEVCGLASAIQQWIIRNFRGVSMDQLADIGPELKKSFNATAGLGKTLQDPRARLDAVSGTFSHYLICNIYQHFPFCGDTSLRSSFKSLFRCISGTGK
jgi:hypothetical protein